MNIFQVVFNLALLILGAWMFLSVIIPLAVAFLPFIGAATAILVVIAIFLK
jgi:hypothetical protein